MQPGERARAVSGTAPVRHLHGDQQRSELVSGDEAFPRAPRRFVHIAMLAKAQPCQKVSEPSPTTRTIPMSARRCWSNVQRPWASPVQPRLRECQKGDIADAARKGCGLFFMARYRLLSTSPGTIKRVRKSSQRAGTSHHSEEHRTGPTAMLRKHRSKVISAG